MKEKTVLITGATGGIGKQTAIALAKMGARVVVTGRSRLSGAQAVQEIRQLSGNAQVELLLADVSSQTDLMALAGQVQEKWECLDVLIHNAGVAAPKRQTTEDRVELNFAANVVAPFLLTHLLLRPLRASPSARVISLMGGDLPARLELGNLQGERHFDGLGAYSQSKLAMLCVMLEFAQRLQGEGITVNVCYPGQASTAMTRGVTPDMLPAGLRWLHPLFRWMTRPDNDQSAAKAARSSVYLASSAELEGLSGQYVSARCQISALPKAVQDAETRQVVWDLVHRLTGVPL